MLMYLTIYLTWEQARACMMHMPFASLLILSWSCMALTVPNMFIFASFGSRFEMGNFGQVKRDTGSAIG